MMQHYFLAVKSYFFTISGAVSLKFSLVFTSNLLPQIQRSVETDLVIDHTHMWQVLYYYMRFQENQLNFICVR